MARFLASAGRFGQNLVRSGQAPAVGVLVAMILLRIWDPAPLEFVRLKTFDLYQYLNAEKRAAPSVVIADIDERSLAELGQWPWPRVVVARLVRKLAEKGAAAIAFDVLFPEGDRTSPEVVARYNTDLPPTVREALRALPTNDERLARVLAGHNVVLATSMIPKRPVSQARDAGPKASFATLGPPAKPFLTNAPARTRNLAALEAAAKGIGLVNQYPEVDGVVRRVPAVYAVGGVLYPSLALELLRVATGQKTFVTKSTEDGMMSVVLAGVEVPTDRNGLVWIKFARRDSSRYISVADILADRTAPDALAGKLVIVGASASGLLDLRSTPLDRVVPGAEVHAQMIENILFRDHIRRPVYAEPLEFLATLALATLLVVLVPRFGPGATLLLGGLAFAVMLGGAVMIYVHEGIMLDPSFPAIATAAVFVVLAFANYFEEARSKQFVRGAFGRYVSPAIVDRLADHPEELLLGAQQRDLSILFSDIRGFTSLSQSMEAEQLALFMNRYLTHMVDAIQSHNGTIDKFIGDAVMAFWNAPLEEADHARECARGALAMIAATERFNTEAREQLGAWAEPALPIRIGIGINTGLCSVGNFGAEQRFDYSALGDEVNIAARLEELTKSYKLPVLVSEKTWAQLDGFALFELDDVTLRGRSMKTKVFALCGDETVGASAAFQEFKRLHERIRRISPRDAEYMSLVDAAETAAPTMLGAYFLSLREAAARDRQA